MVWLNARTFVIPGIARNDPVHPTTAEAIAGVSSNRMKRLKLVGFEKAADGTRFVARLLILATEFGAGHKIGENQGFTKKLSS